MAQFFITNELSAKRYAKKTLSHLPNESLSEAKLSSAITMVYNDQRVSYTRLNDAEVWGFGTFFNSSGFHASALQSIDNLDDFLCLLHQGLRGHYVFVISSGSTVRIITDKIGLLNVFYSDSKKHYISTDPVLVSICASNNSLSEQESKEFILNESTIGSETIFTGTKRLGFGQEIKLTSSTLKTAPIHTYSIEKLSFNDHMNRISNYFKQISKYNGKIAADISAGLDTRTVAAVGHTTIDNLSGNTNPNPNDSGADETISPKIANKLSIPLSTIEVNDGYKRNRELMIHGTTLGRDILRSSRLPKRMEKKYRHFDLILGGYGGETLRAKYNHKSIPAYYGTERSKQLFSDAEYKNQLLSKISTYPNLDTNHQLMNLIYTIDRMRIWGGSWITMSSIYGDILHPFMDWHLINPIFSHSPKKLKNGKYQKRMIKYFAPQLRRIPINATSQLDYYYMNMREKLVKNVEKSDKLAATARKVLSLTGSTVDDQRVSISSNNEYNNIDSTFFADLNIDREILINQANDNTISRIHSVSTVHDYVQRESTRLND